MSGIVTLQRFMTCRKTELRRKCTATQQVERCERRTSGSEDEFATCNNGGSETDAEAKKSTAYSCVRLTCTRTATREGKERSGRSGTVPYKAARSAVCRRVDRVDAESVQTFVSRFSVVCYVEQAEVRSSKWKSEDSTVVKEKERERNWL